MYRPATVRAAIREKERRFDQKKLSAFPWVCSKLLFTLNNDCATPVTNDNNPYGKKDIFCPANAFAKTHSPATVMMNPAPTPMIRMKINAELIKEESFCGSFFSS